MFAEGFSHAEEFLYWCGVADLGALLFRDIWNGDVRGEDQTDVNIQTVINNQGKYL